MSDIPRTPGMFRRWLAANRERLTEHQRCQAEIVLTTMINIATSSHRPMAEFSRIERAASEERAKFDALFSDITSRTESTK